MCEPLDSLAAAGGSDEHEAVAHNHLIVELHDLVGLGGPHLIVELACSCRRSGVATPTRETMSR